MTSARARYAGYRFPCEIISHAVWLYFRFPLGLRMVEELLAARGIIVSHETEHAKFDGLPSITFGDMAAADPASDNGDGPDLALPHRAGGPSGPSCQCLRP